MTIVVHLKQIVLDSVGDSPVSQVRPGSISYCGVAAQIPGVVLSLYKLVPLWLVPKPQSSNTNSENLRPCACFQRPLLLLVTLGIGRTLAAKGDGPPLNLKLGLNGGASAPGGHAGPGPTS
eukprot:1115594-Rhodomonas_salina.3